MECLPRNSPRCNSLLENDKFYLQAENSICPHYVTEKRYRALTSDVFPIFYGGADYMNYASPQSFISDLKSRKVLLMAEYTSRCWTRTTPCIHGILPVEQTLYAVVKTLMKRRCDLCNKLNEPGQKTKSISYADVADLWVRKLP